MVSMGLRERVGYWLLGLPYPVITTTSMSYFDGGSLEMGKASKKKKAGKAKAKAKTDQKQKAAARQGK